MSKTSPVTASVYVPSTKETLRGITVVNPGDWFGKVHILGIAYGYAGCPEDDDRIKAFRIMVQETL